MIPSFHTKSLSENISSLGPEKSVHESTIWKSLMSKDSIVDKKSSYDDIPSDVSEASFGSFSEGGSPVKKAALYT